MQAIPTLLQLLDCDWADDAKLTRGDLRFDCGCEADRLEAAGVIHPLGSTDRVDAACDFCVSHDVVPAGESDPFDFYEVCPYGEGGPIGAEQLRTWSIAPEGIARLLAAAIESDRRAETLLPSKAWQIGEIVVGEEPLSVVLATKRGATALADRREASRMIVIGGGVPAERFAGSLQPTDVFDFSSETVALKPNRLRQAVPLSTQRPGNAFYRKGQVWVVRFDGEETFLENNVGPLYIARLLASPNQAVPAMTLLASRLGIDQRKLTGSSGELADAETVTQCRTRYETLIDEIAEAEDHNDLGRLEALQAEQDQLTSYFASVLGKGGRRREVGDAKKVRQSVSKGIQRTLDVLETELKPLAVHFAEALTLGTNPIYSPAVDVDWLV